MAQRRSLYRWNVVIIFFLFIFFFKRNSTEFGYFNFIACCVQVYPFDVYCYAFKKWRVMLKYKCFCMVKHLLKHYIFNTLVIVAVGNCFSD